MVSDRLMRYILSEMPNGIIPQAELANKLDKEPDNLKRTLEAMQNLGLVIREEIDVPGLHGKRRRVGWRKVVHI